MQAKENNKMQVEVWSDVMCPFCYIGKRQYETALKKFSHRNDTELIWRSYQLDPTIPEHPKQRLTGSQYLAQRKGISLQQVAEMNRGATQMAANAGLEYHLENTEVFNSFKAQRIIQFCKTRGLADVAEEKFFYAHFTENKNLGDDKVLEELSKEIGLSEAEVSEALNNDYYADQVKQDIQEAHHIGVTGVPFFVFDRKYAVSGAQPAEAFLQTLETSFAEWRKKNPEKLLNIADGKVCSTDGKCQ